MDLAIVRRVDTLALPVVSNHGDRTVVLVAHHTAIQVLERNLAAAEIERVAVTVPRGLAEDADVPIIVQPAELVIVGDVAPQQIPSLRVPGGSLRPQDGLAIDIAVPQAGNRRVALGDIAKGWVDGQNVRIAEVHRWRSEVARRASRGRRRIDWPGWAGARLIAGALLRHRDGRRGGYYPCNRYDSLYALPPRHHKGLDCWHIGRSDLPFASCLSRAEDARGAGQ